MTLFSFISYLSRLREGGREVGGLRGYKEVRRRSEEVKRDDRARVPDRLRTRDNGSVFSDCDDVIS